MSLDPGVRRAGTDCQEVAFGFCVFNQVDHTIHCFQLFATKVGNLSEVLSNLLKTTLLTFPISQKNCWMKIFRAVGAYRVYIGIHCEGQSDLSIKIVPNLDLGCFCIQDQTVKIKNQRAFGRIIS